MANLSWQLSDPDGEATVTEDSYYADTEGCVGPIVPRTLNRPETDRDTVAWSTLSLPDFAIRHLYAEYGDKVMTYCDYAPFPVRAHGLDADDHPNIPSSFSLNQNYPNPFNLRPVLISASHAAATRPSRFSTSRAAKSPN